jgi:GNAT superfamily N-acetyltransferase
MATIGNRVIRPPAPGELEAVLDVQEQASLASLGEVFPPPNALPSEAIRDRWRTAFASSENRFSILAHDGEIVGVTMVTTPWLHALQVLPQWWGTGVAAALLDDALEEFRSAGALDAFLRCFTANARARRFWEKHGWEPVPGAAKRHADPPHPEVLTYWHAL